MGIFTSTRGGACATTFISVSEFVLIVVFEWNRVKYKFEKVLHQERRFGPWWVLPQEQMWALISKSHWPSLSIIFKLSAGLIYLSLRTQIFK